MKKRHLQPQLKHIAMCIAAAVHRHRLFRHGIETAVRKNRNIMAVRMWHLPEKAERLLGIIVLGLGCTIINWLFDWLFLLPEQAAAKNLCQWCQCQRNDISGCRTEDFE